MKIIKFFIFYLMSNIMAFNIKIHLAADEFIDYINSKQNNWKAGRNFKETLPYNKSTDKLKSTMKDPALRYKPTVHSSNMDIPDTFDVRTNWPACTNVTSTIYDQSSCGSSWAVATVSAISDRRCIASNGSLTTPVSAEDLLSCFFGNGCTEGYPDDAWSHWASQGIVTGGKYNSSLGCRPYTLQPCDHYLKGKYVSCSDLKYNKPDCVRTCNTRGLEYNSEVTYGIGKAMWFSKTEDIQKEILQNGPVTATFRAYRDFFYYKSGVYHYIIGEYQGIHTLKILGWGTENRVSYWLAANSFNEEWGDNGLIKINRGNNKVFFEDAVFACLPKL